MSNADIAAQFEQAVIPNYTRYPVAIVRGQGSRVWDADGKDYLDLFPGWGVSAVGHCHPRVVEAVREQAGKLFHVANNFYSEPQGKLAAMLHERGDGWQCFFCNSGAEAAEGALKLARLHRQPKYKIVTFENSFHGRTFAAITATGQPAYHKGYTPLVPGFSYARLNDLASVEALVDDETAAIMVEPVQGEGGVVPCEKTFLENLRKLCDDRGMLLIFDEVQTTPGRLGTWFGYQHFGVVPDILTTAKAIGGGMPIGAFFAKPDVAASLVPGTHASTYGGNAIGCAAAIATLEAIEEEKMLGNIASLGGWLDRHLARLADAGIGVTGTRRVGFMIAMDLAFPGADLVADCMKAGLLLNCTHGNILRILPAYNVTEAELAEGLGILEDALRKAGARAGGNA